MRTRTAVMDAPGSIQWIEHELPPPGPHQVLIKVKACALCTWEQRFFRGSAPESYPFSGGHEVSGVVVALGEKANCQAVTGDPVSVAIMTRCGACESCRRGMDNFCENDDSGSLPGIPWGPAGLSDYILVEDYQVYKASCKRDFAELALAEPVACVLRSVDLPPLQAADYVMVQGAGIMGLLHLLLLKQRGMQVVVSEPDPDRRKKAVELGALAAFDPLQPGSDQEGLASTGGQGFQSIFFTAGGVPAVEQAIPLLAKGGWMCLYGSIHPKGMAQIDPNLIHYKELVLTGTFSHTKHSFRQAVALLSSGNLDLSAFITERLPFSQVHHGFERAVQPGTYRVVMTFEDEPSEE
jgi:threonine dehydrogenase-like Zn-dependent dehydrogenase